eukprot:4049886-Prymnesium_polylepis.1
MALVLAPARPRRPSWTPRRRPAAAHARRSQCGREAALSFLPFRARTTSRPGRSPAPARWPSHPPGRCQRTTSQQ